MLRVMESSSWSYGDPHSSVSQVSTNTKLNRNSFKSPLTLSGTPNAVLGCSGWMFDGTEAAFIYQVSNKQPFVEDVHKTCLMGEMTLEKSNEFVHLAILFPFTNSMTNSRCNKKS